MCQYTTVDITYLLVYILDFIFNLLSAVLY